MIYNNIRYKVFFCNLSSDFKKRRINICHISNCRQVVLRYCFTLHLYIFMVVWNITENSDIHFSERWLQLELWKFFWTVRQLILSIILNVFRIWWIWFCICFFFWALMRQFLLYLCTYCTSQCLNLRAERKAFNFSAICLQCISYDFYNRFSEIY